MLRLKVKELKPLSKSLGLRGYSRLNKSDLIKLIMDYLNSRPRPTPRPHPRPCPTPHPTPQPTPQPRPPKPTRPPLPLPPRPTPHPCPPPRPTPHPPPRPLTSNHINSETEIQSKHPVNRLERSIQRN